MINQRSDYSAYSTPQLMEAAKGVKMPYHSPESDHQLDLETHIRSLQLQEKSARELLLSLMPESQPVPSEQKQPEKQMDLSSTTYLTYAPHM